MLQPIKGFKALLLAGGFGTRLKPLTNHTPKCLVPIAGRPLLDYWLEILVNAGIDRILINTHYLSAQVVDFCEKSPHTHLIDIVYESELLGTAGTLRANREYFDGQILLAHADNFTLFNPADFVNAHEHRGPRCHATMMTFITDNPQSCGIIELDPNGVMIGFHEKVANPPGNVANAAVFLLERACLQWLDERPTAIDFCKDILPLGLHKVQAFQNQVYHRDIGTLNSLKKANLDYLQLIGTGRIS